MSGGPSRGTLIQQAVEDGRIDLVTSLLYRAYSAFGLPGLPAEFATGVPRKDDSVFTEMALLMPTLSTEDQQKFRPFLARPTQPDSIFAPQPVALVGASHFFEAEGQPAVPCKKWADSGNLDSHFKVWACADDDAAAANTDIATVVGMLGPVWGSMTKRVPAGMGDPVPDAYETKSDNYGGDDRIDFYLLDLGQVLSRDGPIEIVTGAAAQAMITLPYLSAGATSGFVMLNRSRLTSKVEMKQDVIHEFFHVLQFAHTVKATHDGGASHWFTEATATWSEAHYDREHSDIPHGWFPTQFQTSVAGLEVANQEHQYADYIWPFFMEQEKGASAVFQAWSAIGSVGAADFAGVTRAISEQLPFDAHFHDFALRNLNLSQALASAGVTRYNELDPRFPQNAPPTHIEEANIQPGEPYVSQPSGAPPLGAEYFHFTIGPAAKELTVSLANVSPSDRVDGEALVHLAGGNWQRRQVAGGILKFCREDAADNIDELYLVVSDHSPEGPLLGFLEVSAKESCDQQTRVLGDINWSEQIVDTLGGITVTTTSSGSAHLDLVWDPVAGFQSQGDSRYTFHYSISNCTPESDFAGTIERSIEPQPPREGVATLSILGGAPGQDIQFALAFDNHWLAACDFGGGASDPVETSASVAFPGCLLYTQVTALWDRNSSYVVNCQPPSTDPSYPGRTISGTVTGTLTGAQQASPGP